ncbi:PH domain-containing protein [Sergentomyia squamirostris]
MSETSAKALQADGAEMKGWLLKWTNYLKGYQRRWFVLSNGVLSYYRAEHGTGPNMGGRSAGGKYSIRRRRKGPREENQAEMSHTCRGTISLHGALIHTVDSCTFVISNGGTQTFHIKAAHEVERQSWVTALELAKAKAIRTMESEEEEEDNNALAIPSEELNVVIRDLTARLENLKTCYDLISKHGSALQKALAELETGDDFASKTKVVNEKATLFRISANAMKNACSEYLQTAQTQGHKWSKMLQHERDQRQHLEEMVEQLARQHSHLEQAAHRHRPKLMAIPPEIVALIVELCTKLQLTTDIEFACFDTFDFFFCCNFENILVKLGAMEERGQVQGDHAWVMIRREFESSFEKTVLCIVSLVTKFYDLNHSACTMIEQLWRNCENPGGVAFTFAKMEMDIFKVIQYRIRRSQAWESVELLMELCIRPLVKQQLFNDILFFSIKILRIVYLFRNDIYIPLKSLLKTTSDFHAMQTDKVLMAAAVVVAAVKYIKSPTDIVEKAKSAICNLCSIRETDIKPVSREMLRVADEIFKEYTS